jgi:glycosyltransferase involved in cell wall biosynthesis
MKLLIVAELSRGGIADYAHDQAEALAARDLDVDVLCSPEFLVAREYTYTAYPSLRELHPLDRQGSALLRKAKLATGIVKNVGRLTSHLARHRPDAVLMHFSEYLAPLWAWRLRAARRRGVTFHSVLHDPIRTYRIGPQWWHELSIKEAFSFLDTVFVHARESVPVPDPVKVVWVPHGVHHFPKAQRPRERVRRELAIPASAKLLTAFGYIRDNKNLDLVIRAICDIDDIYLLVAGSEQGGGQKPLSFYIDLAEKLGCADRCRWVTRFISAEEAANMLCASDLSVLTYSRSFVSSSGALGVTANYRLPCIISSGSPTTEALVRRYGLGIWVEPDSCEAIRAGIETWLREGVCADWQNYGTANSWAANAELVHQAALAAGH